MFLWWPLPELMSVSDHKRIPSHSDFERDWLARGATTRYAGFVILQGQCLDLNPKIKVLPVAAV